MIVIDAAAPRQTVPVTPLSVTSAGTNRRSMDAGRNATRKIRNAAAPMTGGMICPLTDDAVSTAPACSAEKPTRFMRGIVKVPVVTTLAMDEPEISPVIADETTAAFAGPPLRCPMSEKAT